MSRHSSLGRGDRDCSAPSGHLAFLQDWEDLQAYAFPFFALLRAFLNKARGTRNLDLTLIASYWPRKEWFQTFLRPQSNPGSSARAEQSTQTATFHRFHLRLSVLVFMPGSCQAAHQA